MEYGINNERGLKSPSRHRWKNSCVHYSVRETCRDSICEAICKTSNDSISSYSHDTSSLSDSKEEQRSSRYNLKYQGVEPCAVGSRKLGLERKRFHERATTDEYEVRFLTSYKRIVEIQET